MPDHIPFIRIFISSPGDVNDERKIALEVIEQLPYRPTFREKVAFRVIAWDKPGAGTPMRATLTPQDAINKGLPTPAECDIVVVLFWSRMGTPLTHDGKSYLSGTHWELLNALEAKRSETVIYRRTDDPPFKLSDPDFDKLHGQYKTVKAFFASDLFYEADGTIKRGINMYKTPDDFRRAFEIDLEVLVLDILKRADSHPPEPDVKDDDNISTIRAVTWDAAKSPFPGLRAFTEADADIFFGRGYETDALIRQLMGSRVVAVVGASGSGKSSLVGAGLIPRLRANAIPGSKDWRIARFTPGEAPFEQLYAALLEVFPHLKPNPLEARRIKQNFIADLREAPETLVEVCTAGLEGAPVWAETLLFVDQFEELFTLASKADAQAFAVLLEAISHCDRVRVVVTMRADFYHRAVEYPQLAELLRTGSFPLAIPKRDALRQMIERPAERAGLTFDHALADRILDDTGDEPGNLALMAYALDELYKLDDDNLLTHSEYEQLGGVSGAIGTRAESVFAALGVDDSIMQQVFHALVEVDERGTATRRRAQFQPDALAENVRKLINAFTTARLLVTNAVGMTPASSDNSKMAVVEVAHEAILRSWPRLAAWIEDTQDDLRLLRQVHNAAQEWDEKGRPAYLLWPQERLTLVYAMRERLKPELSDTERDFIEPEQARLLRELDSISTTHERRRDIGDRLAVIGDTRPGVGVKDGVPELLWLPVEVSPDPVMIQTNEVKIGPIVIPPFFIAQYQITYGQFQTFWDAPDGFDDAHWWEGMPDQYKKQEMNQQRTKITNAPRDSVSWYQSVAFARWLNHRLRGLELAHPSTGVLKVGANAEIRLPTEWEWQWVAQGGMQARAYPWGDWQEGFANTSEAGLSRTTAVGMYPHGRAECEARDLAGNLFDWCLNDKNKVDQISISSTEYKVLRGGSFVDLQYFAASSYRYSNDPSYRSSIYGLRLVVSAPMRL
ncbi:MAG: SUMF1/EgtB/PvdO family nonheme iron enzyme [bacterium]|nr:SUMF1/EgtB/PvdO family nonheme iron enzyme [bacterium]